MRKKRNEKLVEFGKQIRKQRLAAGISQTALAKKVGVSNKNLCNIECGLNWPSLPVYFALLAELETKPAA